MVGAQDARVSEQTIPPGAIRTFRRRGDWFWCAVTQDWTSTIAVGLALAVLPPAVIGWATYPFVERSWEWEALGRKAVSATRSAGIVELDRLNVDRRFRIADDHGSMSGSKLAGGFLIDVEHQRPCLMPTPSWPLPANSTVGDVTVGLLLPPDEGATFYPGLEAVQPNEEQCWSVRESWAAD